MPLSVQEIGQKLAEMFESVKVVPAPAPALISASPRPPRASRPFELVARVEFVPAPGSIRCSVRIGGNRYRNIRLTWDGSIARCVLRVPVSARGKRLVIGLVASLAGSRVRTSMAYTVS